MHSFLPEHCHKETATPRPDPRVLDPVQSQGVATNVSRQRKHYYTQHDQNLVLPLPGDLVFHYRSEAHMKFSRGTLIVRSLPSLNSLLRAVGPGVQPLDIWEAFRFLGVVDFEHGCGPLGDDPLLRMMNITHSGVMRCVNIFDDVSNTEPGVPKTLPRYAYLWLRPYFDDPKTGAPTPYTEKLVPLVSDAAADDDGSQDESPAQKIDRVSALSSLLTDAYDDDWDSLLAKPPQEEEKQKEEPAGVAAAGGHPRMTHPYYWQYVPVCSTHPDLHTGSASQSPAVRHGLYPFKHYDYCIFLGVMFAEPQATGRKPNDLASAVAKYAIHGPFGLQADYADEMKMRRPAMRNVYIDTQTT